jgi:hypothetical protein
LNKNLKTKLKILRDFWGRIISNSKTQNTQRLVGKKYLKLKNSKYSETFGEELFETQKLKIFRDF